MKILITGGDGFIGSATAQELSLKGHYVTITSSTSNHQSNVNAIYHGLNGINWDCIKGQDVVYHFAANNNTLDINKEEMMRINVEASSKLFQICSESNVKKVIYASSASVYGNSPSPYKENTTQTNPLNVYAESKLLMEQTAGKIKSNTKFIGLRYTNVYGPGEQNKGERASMIYKLIKNIINIKPVRLFKYGNQHRDWIYIDDVVIANIKALSFTDNGIFNCGSGQTSTFNELMEIINNKLKTNIKPEYIDCPFKDSYQDHTMADMTKAKEILGFIPKYNTKCGIEELIHFI